MSKQGTMLVCSECFKRNYPVKKRNHVVNERLELMKYCDRCKKHTLHKESK